MRRPRILAGAAILIAFACLTLQAQVRIWEEPLTLPTYRVGPADKNPIFYSGRVYQGAKGPIYPYPLLDKLTETREDQNYRAVYLENTYLKMSVLPEIGGRIFSAQDKGNGYDFFYRQHVIKPALIGMLGAWISGGVEWNIPHHHRATSFLPVDYTLVENADGSKTVWVGETELRHRMRWAIGLTLYPGKSYIETTVRLFNRTPLAHSVLYWANPAVHANPDYQILFPPSTEFATYHAKNQFIRWPLSDTAFNGVDYSRGVDLTWWKNHPSPMSFFAWNYEDDFHVGYDHGKKAGVVSIADHHVMPGKKLWEWGNGPEGRMWDKILTETDGPYIELMVGAFSDNQPDYSWCLPYELKTVKHYWYPIRDLGGVKNANREAAVNLESGSDRMVRFGFNTTSDLSDARALLKAGDRVLFDQRIRIAPDKPFVHSMPLPEGVTPESLRVSLENSAGVELIAYAPVQKTRSPMPEPVKPPPAPQDIRTNEELYLAGLRLEQFYNAQQEPYPYYEEALRRDPGDYRANTALGILYCKRGMFKEAEEKLRTAIRRASYDYTTLKDGEAYYYLGVALRSQGRYQEAFGAFFKSTWSQSWKAAGYQSVAELACRAGDFPRALELAERAATLNGDNTRALVLKAAVLRRLGQAEQSREIAAKVLALDPLDFFAGNELYLGGRSQTDLDALKRRMRDDNQSYLELALDYGNVGLLDEAVEVLNRRVDLKTDARLDPMLVYHLAAFHGQKGDSEKAASCFRQAAQMGPDYCFPFRLESIDVLRRAMAANPGDARAPFYLGNLLYDLQPAAAIAEWEKARKLDPAFAVVHRNLGFGYAEHEGDAAKAIASMEEAIKCDPADPRYFMELDQLYEAGDVAASKRLQLLEKNHSVVAGRDDALARELALQIQVGNYDKALEFLGKHHFHIWEGARGVHDLYVDALLGRGEKNARASRHAEALKDYQSALEFPFNLEVAPRPGQEFPRIRYMIGLELDALGKAAEARTSFEKAAAVKPDWSENTYYQALALRKLGQNEKAGRLLTDLQKNASGRTTAARGRVTKRLVARHEERIREAQSHYVQGLALLGQGSLDQARAEFRKAVDLDINHTAAASKLATP
jgi:tetratricopeptide (TPR) repeat protein